jgi:L-asparaginase II
LSVPTANPILVEVKRGTLVESIHRGAIAIADADGNAPFALGNIEVPVFPRSAVKLMQAIPLVESGAADAYGLDDGELAIACGSHSGDAKHLAAVRSLLAKSGVEERCLACGAHLPMSDRAARELERAGRSPSPVHNNCSGKHAGMLATAKYLGLDLGGYERIDHPAQKAIRRVISETCDVEIGAESIGIDGCSVPTFAVPLRALARGMARLGTGQDIPVARAVAVRRLMDACFAAPELVAGEGRLDTIVMRAFGPKVFVKGGAEGVHCAALPDFGLGIAVKIDDGAKRGADAALTEILAALIPGADKILGERFSGEISNWHGQRVGSIAASAELAGGIRAFAAATPR